MINFHYKTCGSGVPFFFQHGLGADSDQPQALLQDLNCVRLISMDCRAHGQTPLDNAANISFNQYADDVISLANKLAIEKAVFGGISMGAGVALNIALRFPDRVSALVLVRPAWLNIPHPQNLHLLELLATSMREKNTDAFMRSAVFTKHESEEFNTAHAVLSQLHREQPEHTVEILQNMIADIPFKHLSDLKRITVPVLILASHQDFLHPFSYGTTLHESLNNSFLTEVPSRYIDSESHKEKVLGEVKRFLQQQVCQEEISKP
jgi:pimeloyl-ACP methyl ester carboxylesterase